MRFCWRNKKTKESDEGNQRFQNQGSPVTSLQTATSGITSTTTSSSTSSSSGSVFVPNVQNPAEKRPDSTPKKQSDEASGSSEQSPKPQRKPGGHPSGIPRAPAKTLPRTPSPGKSPASSRYPGCASSCTPSLINSTASQHSSENASASTRPAGIASGSRSSPGKSSARQPSPGKSSARTHSPGEASASTKPPGSSKDSKPGQSRPDSGTAKPSACSDKSSTKPHFLPIGNVVPSGKIPSGGLPVKMPPPTAPLNPNRDIDYGYGSLMWKRRGGAGDAAGGSVDEQVQRELQIKHPEELKEAGNEHYKNRRFREAVILYDRAIELLPHKAIYWSNRAAALTGLRLLAEAVRDCEQALRLDPTYARARQRLGMLFLRLGLVENARRQLSYPNLPLVQCDVMQLIKVEGHMSKCSNLRQRGDWTSVLREVQATIDAGANASPQLLMCKAEALLKLHQTNEAASILENIPKSDEPRSTFCSPERFFGFLSDTYSSFVTAKIEMALGRFGSAVAAAEKAAQIEPRNSEVAVLLNNVRLVARARTRGNNLFKSHRFTEATFAYGEGLRIEPTNSVLYFNRAACWFNIGNWQRSIEDCSSALYFQPKYLKALLRRAASYSKIERWEEAIDDYEALRKELPNDDDVAGNLFQAQIALKQSRGEEVSNMKFGGDVEVISDPEQFKVAKSLPGVSVVYFEIPSNFLCKEMSPFMDTLCSQYPSISFFKVDIRACPKVAMDVRVVPAFKIYKNGSRVKEMICPSRDVLELSVNHYSSLN